MKKEYSHQNSSERPYTSPYGIGCAYRQTLCGFSQQSHTYNCKHKESGHPSQPRETFDGFCPSEAVSKANLAEAGDN